MVGDEDIVVVDGVGTHKEVVVNDEDLVVETNEGVDEVVLEDDDIIVEEGSGLDNSASDCCDGTYSDIHDTDLI